ncbi:MAG: hypothetical protein ACREGJ_02715 [Candidatus Saccharimonadales bacterium]
MKTIDASTLKRNKNIIIFALLTALILLIPLVAMQFTDEVNWTLSDFIAAGTLLFGTGIAYELLARKTQNIKYRIAIGLTLLALLALIWIELAVGIFD